MRMCSKCCQIVWPFPFNAALVRTVTCIAKNVFAYCAQFYAASFRIIPPPTPANLKNLVESGWICHTSGNPMHAFVHGFYLYTLLVPCDCRADNLGGHATTAVAATVASSESGDTVNTSGTTGHGTGL